LNGVFVILKTVNFIKWEWLCG